MKKRLLSVFLSFVLILGLLPSTALAADETSGTCGTNATWSFDESTGTLTISGIDAVMDYRTSWGSSAPWNAFQDHITSVIINSGITRIGNGAFGGDMVANCYENLSWVILPNTLESIGEYAFAGSALTSVTLPSGLKVIEDCAFDGTALTSVSLPSSLTTVGDYAFPSTLTSVHIPASVTEIGKFAFGYGDKISSLTVDGANRFYTAEDNVLFDSGKTEILCFGSQAPIYMIPETVKTVDLRMFWYADGLDGVIIPDGVELTNDWSFAEGNINLSKSFSLYFCGDAPDNLDNLGMKRDGEDVSLSVYYVAGTNGWDAYTSKDYWDEYLQGYWMTFHTWTPSGGGINARITSLYPANGAVDVDHESSVFRITFDKAIASIDGQEYVADVDLTSAGAFAIYRASDDQLIYKPSKYETYSFILSADKTRLTISPTNGNTLLEPNVKYYITMDEGFVRFADGTTNTAILKNDWVFKTYGPTLLPIIKKDGTFYFSSGITGSPKSSYVYSYDETWFFNDSYTYQHNLARMSLCVAMSAFDIGNPDRASNIKALMNDLKFSYTEDSVHYPTPTTDSIGYAIGSKNVQTLSGETATIILVAIRGGGYEKEWASNFTLGLASDHAGFSDAANQVIDGVEAYLSTIDSCDNVKIWITGYSRAAATANITASLLDSMAKAGKIPGLTPNNIFAYCFECPRTSYYGTNLELYNNIFSIINPIDIVTKVAPVDWGYERYGITYVLPSVVKVTSEDSLRADMLAEYERIYRAIFADDRIDPELDELTDQIYGQGYWLDNLVSAASVAFDSQVVYAVGWEDIIRAGAAKIGDSPNVMDCFIGIFKDAKSLYNTLVHPIQTIVSVPVKNIIESEGMKIGYAHYPELCLAWLNSMSGTSGYQRPGYRVLYVNCPVSIEVYDNTDNFVLAIQDGNVQDSTDEMSGAFIDENGQYVIILPETEEYKVSIIATDSGSVTYTVTEVDATNGNVKKVVSYYNVAVKTGDVLTGTIENLDIIPNAEYLLMRDDGTAIDANINQSADEITRYSVSVTLTGNGKVTGTGSYVSGEYAKVVATPDSGETFLGWYVNNTLVSSDAEYRFLVDQSIKITGKFTQNTSSTESSSSGVSTYAVIVDSTKNGSVTASSKNASKGTTVTLTVDPDKGYTLETLTVTDKSDKKLELTEKGNGEYTFTMPASKVTVKVTFMEDNTMLNYFVDVPTDAYYYDAVLWAAGKGITGGTSATTFSPEMTCTRAQAVTFLWRSAGSPAPKSSVMPFTDVAADTYYHDAVLWAVENGITVGTSATTFSPDAKCIRAQIVTFLWRSQESPISDAVNPFSDVAVDAYYADAVLWAVENEITAGTSATTFNPNDDCTRAQIVTFLYRSNNS